MPGFTIWMRRKCFQLMQGITVDPITETWVGLLTANPSDDGSTAGGELGTESSLPRQRVFGTTAGGSPYWEQADGSFQGRQMTNVGDVSWSSNDTLGITDTITGVAIYDGSNPGSTNTIAWAPLAASRTITAGGIYLFPTGLLLLRMHKELLDV